MENMLTDEIGIAILLREFCSNCSKREGCLDMDKCDVVSFAEYLIDKGLGSEYLHRCY